MAKIPKYDENKERLLTCEMLRTKVVKPILAKEKSFVHQRKLTVMLVDSPDDPYSLVLRCQGHPDLVKQVEAQVTSLILGHQRAIDRQAQNTKEQSSPEALRQEYLDDKEQKQASPGDKDRKNIQSSKQQKNFNAYTGFSKFYKPVRDIEFSGTGINAARVSKAMWDCHKEKFGKTCGDDCPCPEHLPYLTSTVAISFIANKTKKDPMWKNDLAAPVGFSTSFASKFFQKLQEEHPNETPKQILARLVLMWKEHMRIKRFGMRCSENCPCREGWDAVFKRGRLHESEIVEEMEKAKKTSPTLDRIPRRRPPNDRASDASPNAMTSQRSLASQASQSTERVFEEGTKELSSQSVTGRIPRRPSADQARNTSADAPMSQLISSFDAPIAAKPASTAHTSRLRSDATTIARKTVAPSQPQHYEVLFQPGEAMGFFCVDENRQGCLVCKIASLNDARSKDPRLQVGTVITDVTHEGGHVQPVRTYIDLKKHYEKAKKKGTPIRVRFLNSSASSLIGSMTEAKRLEWTEAGEWIGPSMKGWAGGARHASKKESKTVGSRTTKTSHGKREAELRRSPPPSNMAALLPEMQLGQHKPGQNLAPTVSLQYSTEMAPAKHRTLPKPPSILRKAVSRSKKPPCSDLPPGESVFKALAGTVPRSLRFSDKGFERRFFDKEMPSFRIATLVCSEPPTGITAASDAAVRETAKPKVLGTKDLIDAINNKGFRDIIAVLQAGVSPSARDDFNKSPKDHVKERLEELKFEQAHDTGNRELVKKIKDFELKRKVLSIYLDAIATIDRARFNKKWDRFNVHVHRIKDVCLSVRGAEHEGSKVIECRTRIKGEEMRPLSPIPMEGTILHDWRNDKSARVYSFNYNPHLRDPFRSDVEVSLYKGEQTDATPPILLGQVVFPISRISASVDSKEEIVERLPPNEFVASCTVQLRASKEDESTCRKAKAAEAAGKLKEVVQWITQFNKEAKLDGNGAALSGDIKAPGCGISLLHAATYLHEPDLVAQLLELGADPVGGSDVGSAKMLAQNLADCMNSDEVEKSDEVRQKSQKVMDIMKRNAGCESDDIADIGSDATAVQEDSVDSSMGITSSSLAYPEPQEEATRAALPRPLSATEQQKEATHATSSPRPSAEGESDVLRMPPYALLAQDNGEAGVLTTAAASPYSQLAGDNGGDAKTCTIENGPRALSIKSGSAQDMTVSLPVLDYWEHRGEEACHFFGRPGDQGCRFGSNCHYLHIKPLIGYTLDQEQLDIDDPRRLMKSDCIIRKAQQNQDGRTLYTAAYRDPVDNVLYKAEAGPFIGKDRGVCWYNTEGEALTQLKRVVAHHQSRKQGIYGPASSQSKRPRDVRGNPRAASGHAKRARHERSRDGAPGASPPSRSLFARVNSCRGGSSQIHQNIFGVPLRRTDWSVRHRSGGFVTAELISPLDPSRRYIPSHEGGGKFIDGEYWFKNEMDAKSSAFVSLLRSCIKVRHGKCRLYNDTRGEAAKSVGFFSAAMTTS